MAARHETGWTHRGAVSHTLAANARAAEGKMQISTFGSAALGHCERPIMSAGVKVFIYESSRNQWTPVARAVYDDFITGERARRALKSDCARRVFYGRGQRHLMQMRPPINCRAELAVRPVRFDRVRLAGRPAALGGRAVTAQ